MKIKTVDWKDTTPTDDQVEKALPVLVRLYHLLESPLFALSSWHSDRCFAQEYKQAPPVCQECTRDCPFYRLRVEVADLNSSWIFRQRPWRNIQATLDAAEGLLEDMINLLDNFQEFREDNPVASHFYESLELAIEDINKLKRQMGMWRRRYEREQGGIGKAVIASGGTK